MRLADTIREACQYQTWHLSLSIPDASQVRRAQWVNWDAMIRDYWEYATFFWQTSQNEWKMVNAFHLVWMPDTLFNCRVNHDHLGAGPHGGPLYHSVPTCPWGVAVLLRGDCKLHCSFNPARLASCSRMAAFRDLMKSYDHAHSG